MLHADVYQALAAASSIEVCQARLGVRESLLQDARYEPLSEVVPAVTPACLGVAGSSR